MKFKYKVLIVNIILLSIALGFSGFFMINRNFRLSKDSSLENAVIENNMAQSSVEYILLDYINYSDDYIFNELSQIGNRVGIGVLSGESDMFIFFGDNIAYDPDGKSSSIPQDLLKSNDISPKNYIITVEDNTHYVYVSSVSYIDDTPLLIVTKKSIEEPYSLIKSEMNIFRLLLIGILLVGGVIMYFLCDFLTKPLVNLNKISDEMADGNYKTRAKITSNDEVGQLSAKFNYMAMSVDNRVEELKNEIDRREQFVADFTHEIKTPMTSIIGYADTMRSIELSREEQLAFLDYIYSSGKRLEVMSRKLFDLIYLSKNEIETSPIHTELLASDIEKLALPSLNMSNINCVFDVKDSIIKCDRELLTSVFINLIDNSRKASSPNSTVYVTGYSSEGKYYFVVRDEGIGINEQYLDKICNEFFMIDKSRSRSEGSSGLGLPLASLIVHRHGGEMKIASTEGVGTTITIILPEVRES